MLKNYFTYCTLLGNITEGISDSAYCSVYAHGASVHLPVCMSAVTFVHPAKAVGWKENHLAGTLVWSQGTFRVATNLEYSGISPNMENSGNSVNFVQPQGKIVTNEVF